MHVCEEFRERITEQILDHKELDSNVEIQRELLVCNGCFEFYTESKDVVDALSNVRFEIAEAQWDDMADRLNARIHEDYATRRRPAWRTWFGLSPSQIRTYVPALAGALAMLLVTAGVYRLATPLIEQGRRTVTVSPALAVLSPGVNPDPLLDSVTVDFLEQSELLLRSVMKLQLTSVDDIEQAKKIADRQLIALDQRKQAAFEIQPVVNAMDKYETILRDIRNLNQHSVADDIAGIRNRIEKNGLIAEMKAFQPKYSAVESDLGNDK